MANLVFTSGQPRPNGAFRPQRRNSLSIATPAPAARRIAIMLDRIQQLSALGETAQPTLTPLLNEFKRDAGKLIGLRDDRLVTRKTFFEQKIRRAVESDSKLGPEAAKVWDEVASAYKKWAPYEKPWEILEAAPAPGSKLFQRARRIVRGETPTDPAESIDNQVEIVMLTRYLEELRTLGEKDAPLKTILGWPDCAPDRRSHGAVEPFE